MAGLLIWASLAVVVMVVVVVLAARRGVSMQRGKALLVVGMAVVEVAIFEAMIRLDAVGAERAGEMIFILILLNFGFVQVLRLRH